MGRQRKAYKNRRAGTYTVLIDTAHPDNTLAPDGGRWVTLCNDHGNLINHRPLQLATDWLHAPWEWCEGCRDIVLKQ